MATVTITASGTYKWTDTGVNTPWPSGSPPAGGSAGDDVILNNAGLVLNIAGTSCVAKSVVVTLGTLGADLAASNTLTVHNSINTAGSSSAKILIDVSSVPQYTTKVLTNGATGYNDLGIFINGDFDFIGASKTEYTYVQGALVGSDDGSGAMGCTVDAATGWYPGDILVFCTTQAYNATPKVDKVTIATVDTGTGSITWTDGVGTGGALKYSHADNCIIGNFTRNLIIGSPSGSNANSAFICPDVRSRATAGIIRNVMFDKCRQANSTGGVLVFNGSATAETVAEISSCAFYEWQGVASAWSSSAMGASQGGVSRSKNIYYSATASATAIAATAMSGPSIKDESGLIIFRAATGIGGIPPGCQFIDAKISGCTYAAINSAAIRSDTFTTLGSYGGSGIWSCAAVYVMPNQQSALLKFDSVRIGLGPHATAANYLTANNATVISTQAGVFDAEFYNCDENISGGTLINAVPNLQTQRFKFFNRDLNLDTQEIYQNTSTTVPSHNKSVVATELTRSTSSLVMTWTGTANYVRDYVVSVPAKAGAALRILIYVAKSATNSPVSGDVAYGASTLPYATLSGLGITPVTVTLDTDSVAGYDSGVFELMVIDLPAVSAPASDGELTLTLTGQSATSASQCYWAGVPAAPFITRCRHFGYLFDETSLTRTRDPAVTISAANQALPTPTELVASETTAAGIGGITISWGATSSITAFGASKTFQQIVDYVAAKACVNVGSALPVTWAGSVGNPALFAAGNITVTDGFVVNGSGSISMNAYTLATEFASGINYTYTGGTFSQASTVPTFSGGTLNIGAAGTYTFTQAASMTVSATPTSASNYVLSSGTFTGTLTFHNTTAYNITVEVPSGIDTPTSAGSPGAGTVTFVSPQIYQKAIASGFTAGSRIQIYDETSATELFNGTASAGDTVVSGSTATWTDPTAAAADRAIRVRVAYVNGTSAEQWQQFTGLTCGQTGATTEITYPVTPIDDDTYNANAIDGPAIYATSGITFTDAATDLVNISIAGGAVTWQTIYACFVYWLFTAAGIDDDVAYIDAPDPANYLLTSMKLKNTHANPLTVTGGYGRSATTGLVADIIDTAGSTGNIFPSPDHVVAYATGSGALTAGDITNIWAAATRTLSATQDANIVQVAGITVDGTGTDGDPWGPQ